MGSNKLTVKQSWYYSYSRESTTVSNHYFLNNFLLNSIMTSKIRQNYHEESEALINKQINMEFYASYVYLSVASYFNRDDQALPGLSSFFQKSSDEERSHGMKLMEYRPREEDVSSSRILPSPAAWSGALHLRQWRLLLSWKKQSTRVFLISTRPVTAREMLISVTSSRLSSLVSRWKESRSWVT